MIPIISLKSENNFVEHKQPKKSTMTNLIFMSLTLVKEVICNGLAT